jgi:mannitol/fructose-specific phosphotransferase system IIA component (Ntr-type)
VTLNEIVGPLFTRIALKRSREVGLDRPRLMEFLQEEFIFANLRAKDKWEAIQQLTEFFLRTHRVDTIARKTLENTVVEREKSMSTAVGSGAALPHGRIQHGPGVQGVLGIAPDGIEWDTPDGEPVRIVVLIVTPKEHERQHLEVLASLSTMISNDSIRTRLMSAMDANDAWEVIEAEEAPNFNYFFEEPDDRPEPQGH